MALLRVKSSQIDNWAFLLSFMNQFIQFHRKIIEFIQVSIDMFNTFYNCYGHQGSEIL